MKMAATCGIQKFSWREKIRHLSKYWGSSTQNDPAGQILGGRDPCNPCGVDAYEADRTSSRRIGICTSSLITTVPERHRRVGRTPTIPARYLRSIVFWHCHCHPAGYVSKFIWTLNIQSFKHPFRQATSNRYSRKTEDSFGKSSAAAAHWINMRCFRAELFK